MELIIVTVIAGVIATAGMTFVLYGITRSGWANADMVRALGSFFTKSLDNAMPVGLVIHFFVGIPIALFYTVMLNVLRVHEFIPMIIVGGLLGFVHGFFFSFVMLSLDEHHPVEQFQHANIQISFAHIAGHVVYGLLVGLVVGISGYRMPL